jgi:hypothetical protein
LREIDAARKIGGNNLAANIRDATAPRTPIRFGLPGTIHQPVCAEERTTA